MIAATPRPYTRRRWCAERARAMFDGRDPDFDDEAREDLEAIRLGTPAPSAKKGIVSRVRSRAASLASPQNARASPQNADSDSDDDDAMVTRRARRPSATPGGRPSAKFAGVKFAGVKVLLRMRRAALDVRHVVTRDAIVQKRFSFLS